MTDFATSNIAGVNVSQVYEETTTGYNRYTDTIPFALGTMCWGSDGTAWVFVKYGTGGSTGAGYVLTFDEDFLAVMMSNSVGALGDKIGVAGATATVDQYGWAQVYGVVDTLYTAGATSANTALASTSTAGKIDDATGTGTKNLSGIILTTAAGSATTAPGVLNWPVIGSTN